VTSVLERPVDVAEPEVAPPAGRPSELVVVPGAVRTPAHVVLGVLLGAAGLIHLVVVPPHFGESTADGAAFLVSGWVQLVLAVAVVAWPRRAVAAVAGLVSAVLVGAWVLAHSVGLPYGSHKGAAEAATFVSQVCVALEVAAVLLAVVLAVRPGAERRSTRHRRAGVLVAGLASVAVLGAATAAVASPSARGHEEAAAGGHGHAAGAGAGAGHGTAGDPSVSKVVDDRGYSLLGNGHEDAGQEHAHGGVDQPLDDATEVMLRQQIAHAYELQARYPTVADAEADGFQRQGPFSPGLGAHYSSLLGGAEIGSPEGAPEVGRPMLIFDGTDPDSPIAGFMYSSVGSEAPAEGFAGPNDVWHLHSDLCLDFGSEGLKVLSADDEAVTQASCTAEGGFLIEQTSYMVHLWTVPGYESSEGLFSNLNPAIRCPDGTYFTQPEDEPPGEVTNCRSTGA
jgi:hypothetical protein